MPKKLPGETDYTDRLPSSAFPNTYLLYSTTWLAWVAGLSLPSDVNILICP